MIRHILLFTLAAEASPQAATAMLDELAGFPSRFVHMRNWEFGRNASGRDTTFEYAMTVTFDDSAALHSYLDSEAHERFVAERFRPLVARRAIATFEL